MAGRSWPVTILEPTVEIPHKLREKIPTGETTYVKPSLPSSLGVRTYFVVSARRGEVVDPALLNAAVTYFVQLILLWALPRMQAGESDPPIRLE